MWQDIERTIMTLHPIVKWAGGKTQILEKLKERMPRKFKTYYEPFVGGGALLFAIQPKKFVVNDTNKELIAIFKCLRNPTWFEKMYSLVKEHEKNHSEEYYYQVREMDRKKNYIHLPLYVRAARAIYLNKSCFNGLYRVNSKGYFNVPFNGNLKLNCFDDENVKALHQYFNIAKPIITSKDFSAACHKAIKGDFVYFDPPYDEPEGKNSFTTYTKCGFGREEQARLARCFKRLDKRGVKVMLSNHNTPYINELYAGYNIQIIEARRAINSKGNCRGKVEEVIITNY